MRICECRRKPHADTLPAYRVGEFDYEITDRRVGMIIMMRLLKEHGRGFINIKNMRTLWEIADLCQKNDVNNAREEANKAGWKLVHSAVEGWFVIMCNGGPEISLTSIS